MANGRDRFFYFGFGSNLLQQRIRIKNPSAEYVAVGVLKDYSLRFFKRSNELDYSWFGCSATITEMKDHEVYGTIWSLDQRDIPSLDDQEDVHEGLYHPLEVNVLTATGEHLLCRTYQGTKDCVFGAPSPYYLDVILRGAVQSNLPSNYVSKLREIGHNGYLGPCPLYQTVLDVLGPEEKSSFEVDDLRKMFEEESSK